MLKPGDADRFAQIIEAAIVAERMFLRIQFDADPSDKTLIERCQTARRNAIGLRKAVEEWPVTAQT